MGSSFEVNTGAASLQQNIPIDALGVKITLSNTRYDYTNITVRSINFKIINTFPKIASISAQTTRLTATTVPVYAYYTTTSATLTASSSDQTVIANSGITTGGSGFNRSIAFTPLKNGTATITLTLNDGTSSATASFSVTVHEPAKATGVNLPASGFYGAGGNLDFTVQFDNSVTGGSASTLPLTIGGTSAAAAYLSSTASSITYRYTLGSSDTGTVAVETAIDDASSPITDADGYAAEVGLSTGATGITALLAPEVTSSAAGGSATYGTRVTLTATLTCASSLSGTVQFKAGGVDIGSPVTVSGNAASYETTETTLDAGSVSITAAFIPSGASYHFTSLTSSACALTINPKSVSVSGFAADAKTYDGTPDVSLSGGTLSGVLTGDTVSASYPSAGTAAEKNTGTRSVTYSPIVLTGADKDNYTLSAQPSVSVVISPKTVTPSATVSDKAYNGNKNAAVTGVVFDGLVLGESLVSGTDYTASGVFDSGDAGNDIPVTVTVTLAGTTAAGNYTLASNTASTTADITPKALSISGIAATNRTLQWRQFHRFDGRRTVRRGNGRQRQCGF